MLKKKIHWHDIHPVKSIESHLKSKRTRLEQIEDWIVAIFGTTEFLLLNFAFIAGWISVNIKLIPLTEPFDPFPFVLLTTILSIEAIILAIFVLITQNRQAKIESLRQETELHVDFVMEKEITKILKILAKISKKVGVRNNDRELKKMLKPLNTKKIERQLEKQLGKK